MTRMLEQKRADAGIVVNDFASPPIGQVVKAPEKRYIPRTCQPEYGMTEEEIRENQRKHAISCQMNDLARDAGERYANCRIGNFKATTAYQKKVVDTIVEYGKSIDQRKKNREGLVLFGPVGTGKDHLAFALGLHCASAGCTVRWVSGQSWFGSIRDAMGDNGPSEESIIYSFARSDIVILSDPLPPIGDLTQHQATMLYRAVEERYADGKLTITTVNVADDDEADRRMGAPTWDRLCHNAWKIHCRWPSYRKPARELKP